MRIAVYWSAPWSDGMKTLHGFSTHGFPNCFQMGLGGKVSERGGLNSETYTPGVNAFNAVLAEWRATGELPGLELG